VSEQSAMQEASETASDALESVRHLERLVLAYHKGNGERLAAIEQGIGTLPELVRQAVEAGSAEGVTAMHDLAQAMRAWEARIEQHTRALDTRAAIEQERTRIIGSALSALGGVIGHRYTLSLLWALGLTVVLRVAGIEPGPLVLDMLVAVVTP